MCQEVFALRVRMIMSNRAQWSWGAGTSNDQNLWMVLSEVT
jgi:hypothetical protein